MSEDERGKGFFKRFRRRGVIQDEEQVPLSSLVQWLERQEEGLMRTIHPEVGGMADATEGTFRKVRSKGRMLLESDLMLDSSGRPRTASERSKDTLGRKLLEMSERFERIDVSSFEMITRFEDDLSSSLLQLVDLGRAYSRPLLGQFGLELRELNADVKQINSILESLRRLISENKEVFGKVSKARTVLNGLLGLRDGIAELSSKIEEMENQILRIKEAKEGLEDKIKLARRTEEYSEYAALSREAEVIDRDMANLRARLEQETSSLAKPMRKMMHMAPLEKKEKSVAELFLEEPLRAMIEDHQNLIPKLLKRLKDLLESGRLEVKREAKIIERIESLQSDLPSISQRYRNLDQQLSSKRVRLETSSSHSISNLERSLAENTMLEEELRTKIEREKLRLEALRSELMKEIETSEKKVSEMGLGSLKIVP